MSQIKYFTILLIIEATLFSSSLQFGLSSDNNFYTVQTDAGLVFKIRRTDDGASTRSAGDIASMVYNGVEYQNAARGSQINSGFDYLYNGVSAVSVNGEAIGNDFVKITVQAGQLTHYYMARRGFPHIYMATYFDSEPNTLNMVRYIVRIPSSKLPNGPPMSDIRGTTRTVESGDIFALPNGETRSKHYSNMRLIDWTFIGAAGNNVGIWMVRDNQEGGSGGPFYRSLLNQCGDDQEITYITNYGEAQTEAFRPGILNGPYTLAFTNGEWPPWLDVAWVGGMGLRGYIPYENRGRVQGHASGIPAGFQIVLGWANERAQYWQFTNDEGNFLSPDMIPGDYTMTLYKGELAVATDRVTVTPGFTETRHINSAEPVRNTIWRIGEFDGRPTEFLNGDKITTMHPSDPRMSPWGPVTFYIGQPPALFPCYQWREVNDPTTIIFDLAPNQIAPLTVTVGITVAYAGGRPRVGINGWQSSIPAATSQPSSRTMTVGTYRGNNVYLTYNVPASALVVGTNTMTLTVVSGSSGPGFLSPGYSYDAVELSFT